MANRFSPLESLVVMASKRFWQGKRVLITGHTGFKGSWLSLWLQSLGAKVCGVALDPPTEPSLFKEANVEQDMESIIADIRDLDSVQNVFQNFKPEIIFHMAAQPLVRHSYENPIETYSTNVLGTVNVLEAARHSKTAKAIINITTDKCYENREWVWGYREEEPMGGHDPYSSSKGCSELVSAAYRNSYFKAMNIGLATARAGNVIGGGDWATDRLVPDILDAITQGKPVLIRNPKAVRPWQHVLEPLSGYLTLAESLLKKPHHFDQAFNFGPKDDDSLPVLDIVRKLTDKWGDGAEWLIDSNENPHEANYLKLDISKARMQLGWNPRWSLDKALTRIVDWQRAWLSKSDMKKITLEQIKEFMSEGAE